MFSKGCPVELAANGETFLEKGFPVAAMLARAANRKHGSDGETFLETPVGRPRAFSGRWWRRGNLMSRPRIDSHDTRDGETFALVRLDAETFRWLWSWREGGYSVIGSPELKVGTSPRFPQNESTSLGSRLRSQRRPNLFGRSQRRPNLFRAGGPIPATSQPFGTIAATSQPFSRGGADPSDVPTFS